MEYSTTGAVIFQYVPPNGAVHFGCQLIEHTVTVESTMPGMTFSEITDMFNEFGISAPEHLEEELKAKSPLR